MITIFHGEDTAASRKALQEAKTSMGNFDEKDSDSVTMTDLVQFFDSTGLFFEQKNLILEHFISQKQKTPEFDALVSYLTGLPKSSNVVIWEAKELMKNTLTPFKGAVVNVYKFPSVLFAFLDAIGPENGIKLLKLFHKTIEHAGVEMVFFMLIRHVRLLLAVSHKDVQIDEVKRLQSWQTGKLQSQAKLFQTKDLLLIYRGIHELDVKQKTGDLSVPLPTAIDFWLLSL